MVTILSHGVRGLIDIALFGIMLYLDIYDFTNIVLFFIVCRIVVGHLGRIFQYVIGDSDDVEGCLAGLVANGIKTILEAAILLNLYGVWSMPITVTVILLILARNVFEAVSLCEEFSE